MWDVARELVLGFDALSLTSLVKFTEYLLCARHQAQAGETVIGQGLQPHITEKTDFSLLITSKRRVSGRGDSKMTWIFPCQGGLL